MFQIICIAEEDEDFTNGVETANRGYFGSQQGRDDPATGRLLKQTVNDSVPSRVARLRHENVGNLSWMSGGEEARETGRKYVEL